MKPPVPEEETGAESLLSQKPRFGLAQTSMGKKETVVSDLCKELGVTLATLYRHVGPDGKLREYGKRVLNTSVS